jgi:hypothetical protein
MSLYTNVIQQLTKMLRNLDVFLDQAEENATSRKYDAELLLNARLSPDQWPLVRQIQAACDLAKFATARLTGIDAPSHPDTETTLVEIRARIASTLAFIDGVDESAFETAATRVIAPPMFKGGFMPGETYANQFVLPNFYFHMTTAYAILRHNGVPLGKRTFLGHLSVQPPA